MSTPTPVPGFPVILHMAGMPDADTSRQRTMRMGKLEEGAPRGEVWALARAAIILLLTMGVISVLIV